MAAQLERHVLLNLCSTSQASPALLPSHCVTVRRDSALRVVLFKTYSKTVDSDGKKQHVRLFLSWNNTIDKENQCIRGIRILHMHTLQIRHIRNFRLRMWLEYVR